MEFDPGLAEYPCTNCTERLGSVHIECAVCEDIRLCLECFSCGAEFSRHERTHDYRVKNTRGKIIFHDESCEKDLLYSSDEMALLEAVERFNLGNWDDVAAHVANSMWSPKDLRDHYDRYYLHGKIAKATKLNLKPPLIKDHCSNDINDTCNKDIISKVNADDLTMIAYMPNRDDFEKEYNNEAESVLANLGIIPDDDDEIDRRRGKSFQPDVAVKKLRKRTLQHANTGKEPENYDSALEHQEALENGNTCVAGTKSSRPKTAVAVPTPATLEATRRNKKCRFYDSNCTIIQHPNDYRTFSPTDESESNFLLSNSEKTSCQLYNITPEDYKLLKMDLLIDCARQRRPWTSLCTENRVELNDNCLRIRNCVQNFMLECGWLS
uniref:Uncharacterized protein n=1 Tax=Romanomermis culicivorax TaxID=13658 RepID=A0A915HXM7_ROMCU